MLETCLENVRKTVPLVHNITNYVTVNDVANILLACGGSPIMSDEPDDVEDITSICGGLNINLGTLNKRSIEGMFRAGKKAQECHHVLLLDPVGVGASKLRTETAFRLMEALSFTAIRGNISEIKTLALGSGTTKGVDADVADAVTEENLDSAVSFVKNFAAAHELRDRGYRCDRSCRRCPKMLRDPKRKSGDGENHRNRLPALRNDDSLSHSQQRPSA